MYIIANYDRNWKCDKTYNNFNDAFMKYQILNDNRAVIEHIDFKTYKKTVVWSSAYETVKLNRG